MVLVVFPSVLSSGYQRNLSNNGADDKHSKIYELRQYNIYPQHLKPFLELSVQGLVMRAKFSKMIGYWSAELGGLNQVIHIWEYDSIAHRASVRQSLASDPEWTESYFSKILPHMNTQENSVLRLLPWSPLESDLPAGGLYELQTFRYKEPNSSEWGNDLENYATARGRTIKLVAAFKTTIAGHKNSSIQLWHYPDLKMLEVKQSQLEEDKTAMEAYARLLKKVSDEQVKILVPQPWSPLK
ncbi:protein NipSnap homolog 3B-like [Liolophura sinensis]|uniref:protein NipSnap homolog 3B-like n=1 Tax=Liolophura sinensis TaxID=3198878 RepID=UPI0031595EC7